MNKAILIGNLARDPEMRTTSSGVSVCTFTLAVNRKFTNQQGVREADFITCVAWRQTAEFVGRYFSKGKKMAVVGTIQTRSYDAQDGTKRYVTEVVAEEVEFVEPKGSGGGRMDDVPLPQEPPSFGGSGGGNSAPTPPMATGGFVEADDDELPF